MWGVVDDHRKNEALSRADAAASSADSLLVLPCVDSTAQLQRPGFRFAREKKSVDGSAAGSSFDSGAPRSSLP